MSPQLEHVLATLSADKDLWRDFNELCDFGGRRAGTPSEAATLDWCETRLREVGTGTVTRDRDSYHGWHATEAHVTDPVSGETFESTPLLGTQFTPEAGIEARLLDLGAGRPEDFERSREQIKGRIVLVRHEYPFSPAHFHRRRKLGLAQEMGAVGFLIAFNEEGVGPVSGSSGRNGGQGIPAFGLSREAADRLLASSGRVRLTVQGHEGPEPLSTLLLDLPGTSERRIVISAHLDGHPGAESAIDNATGLATVLALGRAFGSIQETLSTGITVAVFSAEEWGLAGSRVWLRKIPENLLANMQMNLNLDSIAGSPNLTALTSGFAELDSVIEEGSAAAERPIRIHRPLMPNSDHANFAAMGVPAMRLIAGFDEPQSHLRYLLTNRDTRDLVDPHELQSAAVTAGAVACAALGFRRK